MAWFGKNKETVEPPTPEAEPLRLPEPPALNELGLRSMQDHADYLLNLVEPLKPFGMSLLEAWDQVVCEDLESLVDVPAHSTAVVDGYAVRASDLTDEARNQAETMQLFTGEGRLPLGAVQAVQVGQQLPAGATAVLPDVFVAVEENQVRVFEPVSDGDYVRARGEHLSAGQPILKEGELLNERIIGLLASAGIDKVFVRPRPRVVVVSSGAEIVAPGHADRAGEGIDANSFLIAAAARAAGAQVFHTQVSTNDAEKLAHSVTDQLIRADLVISTTGGRREDYEAMVEALRTLGQIDSAQVAMTPGRTQTFGLIGEDHIPVIMLPGNPVSAYVSFQAFCRPLIRKLAGGDPHHKLVRGITNSALRSVAGHNHLLRARVSHETGMNRLTQVSLPHALSELSEANALIIIDEETTNVPAGRHVHYWELD